jgi:hypothetical protein
VSFTARRSRRLLDIRSRAYMAKIMANEPAHEKLIAEGIRSQVAPLKELQKKFGFKPEQVAAAARELLGR